MSGWNHPKHYTPAAKAFAVSARAAEIALFLDRCLPGLRDAARGLGYALALHGSLTRDVDLIAVPWTPKAGSAEDLANALAAKTKELTGWGIPSHTGWSEKPHGRTATTIIATAEVHLDLSVMPRSGGAPMRQDAAEEIAPGMNQK